MAPITLEQALLTLEGTGPVLDIARELTRILRDAHVEGAIIGGVAVALHGYLRTTADVDVLIIADPEPLSEHLRRNGFTFDAANKQFIKRGVPIHLVTPAQTGLTPRRYEVIDDIQTVSLADLINIKLRSGSKNLLRAKDLGDVIGLIRHHRLGKEFTPHIEESLRDEFRTIVDAIESDRAGS